MYSLENTTCKMSVTGRITVWLLPTILICGGCTAPAMFQPRESAAKSQAEEAKDTTGNQTIGNQTSKQASSEEETEATSRWTKELSPAVVGEAALIRQTAIAAGYSEAEATRIKESLLYARPQARELLTRLIYAQLRRQNAAENDGKDQEGEKDSVALAAAQSASVHGSRPSPTSVHMLEGSTESLTKHGFSQHAADGQRAKQAAPAASINETTPRPVRTTSTTKRVAGHGELSRAPSLDNRTGSTERADNRGERETAAAATDGSPARSSPTPNQTVARREDRTGEPGIRPQGTDTSAQAKEPSAATEANEAARQTVDSPASGPVNHQHHAASEADETLSWQHHLRLATTRLRGKLTEDDSLDSLEESRLRASLGLMQLLAEDPEKAMVMLEGLDDHQLEFWRQTVMGLNVLMSPDGWPKMRYRVESAAEHLQSGLSALETLGPLRVANLAFVRDVRSFGVYDDISGRGFEPGEHVILYVEIGNFTVEETTMSEKDSTSSRWQLDAGSRVPIYETELVGRYDIVDSNQRIVMSRTLPVIRDRCRQHRRDFFVAYEFHMPPEIDSGHYSLELTIEDRKGDKFGSGAIEFRIR